MDRETDKVERKDWSWLPKAIPAVSKLIAEKKSKHGAKWVGECWRRGVVQGEPGYFWAAEGVLCVGTPANAALVNDWYQIHAKFPGASMLILPDAPSDWVK